MRDGEWVKLDSAEVVHGLFSMKGKVDSVQMVTLYMDDESIMPIVLESGKIKVTISNTDLKSSRNFLEMQHCMTSLTKEMHWKKVLGSWNKRKLVW